MTRTKQSNVGLVYLWTAVYADISCSKRHGSGYRAGCGSKIVLGALLVSVLVLGLVVLFLFSCSMVVVRESAMVGQAVELTTASMVLGGESVNSGEWSWVFWFPVWFLVVSSRWLSGSTGSPCPLYN